MKKYLKYISLFILFLFVVKCANQQPPPGGPKDTEPPQIIEIYPENGTLNFSDNYFEITFSEYVEKLSLLDALFISPEIENLEYDWTGTSVEITFDDTLEENTTYTVSIGSGIKDLNNQNPMEKAMNISFSTGDKIDVGSISGSVFDKDLTGTMIFAYHKVDTFANPLLAKAKNITQVGENGVYQLLGLKNGEYRVFAIKDEGGNRLYNIGDDAYGVSSSLLYLSDSAHSISGIDFKLTREDTIPPYISNVTMTDKHHISIEYSEPLDSSKLTSANFYIYDSTSQSRVDVKFLYQGNKSKFEYFISNKDSINSEGDNYLIAENVSDKFNNIIFFDSYQFVVSDKPDTVAPIIKSISTDYDGNKIDYLNPKFTLIFSDGIDVEQLDYAILLDEFNWKLNRINDAVFEIVLLNELDKNQKIEFKFNHNKISDAAGNSLDSVQTISLETLSGREFTGLSGSVDIPECSDNCIVVIENVDIKNLRYSTRVIEGSEFNFERILPGYYTILTFFDDDSNGIYNYGSVVPFELSEKFFIYPDTLNLRARWPVGDLLISE
ncbi:MAG: Ig-like domain-containing protein [Melioribacteraceae bacterium]|nr:Ig-like domain-containing protein [Melioribacteraceae bacterium]